MAIYKGSTLLAGINASPTVFNVQNSSIETLPDILEQWAYKPDTEENPTDIEVKIAMTNNSSELLGTINGFVENGQLLKATEVSTIDRRSISTDIYTVSLNYKVVNTFELQNWTFNTLSNSKSFFISYNPSLDLYRWNEDAIVIDESACFVGDTLVHLEDGIKPISQIKIGDRVLSFSKDNKMEVKPVYKIFSHNVNMIYNIETNGNKIKSSWSHPFYVAGKDVPVLAINLSKKDKLINKNNRKIKIKDYFVEKMNKPTLVYEIGIEDNNNYFVGEEGILVHNEPMMIKEEISNDN